MKNLGKYTSFWALDLEMAQPSGAIIQIGFSVYDMANSTFTTKSFLVNPNEPLSEFIADLTGITDEALKNSGSREFGISLASAWFEENVLSRGENLFPEPIVWGQGDLRTLIYQMSEVLGSLRVKRSFDVKSLANFWSFSQNDSSSHHRNSLQTALKKYKVHNTDTRAHDAGADAYNTMRLFVHFLTKMKAYRESLELGASHL